MGRSIQNYPDISLESGQNDGKLDFEEVFGRIAPVYVEIGSGKGTFLVEQGRQQPEVNFLGIEYARRYFRYAVDRVGRWGLENVRLVRAEAAGFLRANIAAGSVDGFHIYFPDPWPKRRHHKRRFFQPENVELLVRCLKTGGFIKVATDHSEYFEQIRKVLLERYEVLEEIDFRHSAGARGEELVGTNFERKYLRQGRRTHSLAVRRK